MSDDLSTAPSKTPSKVGIYVSFIAAIVIAVVVGIVWIRHVQLMGTRLVISGNEAVNYSGTATEAQARALGEALTRVGYFGNGNEIDVLFNKSDSETTLSFVVSTEGYTDPVYEAQFRFITEHVAYAIGGVPINVRLLSSNLNTKKEFKVETTRWGTPEVITAKELVYRLGSTTADEAKALGKALQDIEFFKGDRPRDVFLRKEAGITTLSFVTSPAAWQDEAIHADFRKITDSVAPSIGGKPITLHLVDDTLAVRAELKVE